MPQDSQVDQGALSRISKLETGHATLETGQQSLGREIGQMRESLDTFTGEIRRGMERIHQDRAVDHRANYPLILSAIGVLVALGALVSGGINADIARVEGMATKWETRAFEEAAEAWRRPDHDRFAETVKGDHDRLDKALQREMRDLNNATASALAAMGARVNSQLADLRAEQIRLRAGQIQTADRHPPGGLGE